MALATDSRVGRGCRHSRVALLLASLVLPGCGGEEAIRHYKVPKPEILHARNHVGSGSATAAVATEPNEPTPGPGDASLKYQAPANWSPRAPDTISVLAFGVTDGDRSAQITVSLFRGDGGGLLPNLNRWYRQAGMPAINEDNLSEKTEPLEVGGIIGTYVEAIGNANQGGGKAIVGWIGVQGKQSWFVKISGDPRLVRGQRKPFRNFLKTLEFNAP